MKSKRKFMTFAVSLILLLTLFTVPAFASGDTLATEEVTEAEVILDQTEASIFDDIYDAVLTNADKILSALAFCGTVIVGFAYKKGLLPLLGKAMTAISRSVEGIKEDGIKSAQSTEERLTDIDDSIKEIRESASRTDTAISEIEEHLARYEAAITQYSAMKTVMSAQTDMLYSVFMSSALPQYQKEEVGERINAMKKELKLNENSD
jgi:hypothetical protein